MKAIVLALLVKSVKSLITGDLYNRIKVLVAAEMTSSKTKAEKRQAVKDAVAGFKGDLAKAAKAAGENLINLAIETAVATIKK